jgi:hypothetical protein
MQGAEIAQSVWRQTTGCAVRIALPVGARHFSLLHSVQAGSEAAEPPYPIGTGGPLLGGNEEESEADHSPLSSAEVNNKDLSLHSRYVFIAWRLNS